MSVIFILSLIFSMLILAASKGEPTGYVDNKFHEITSENQALYSK